MENWIELKGFDCLNCGSSLLVNTTAKQSDDRGTWVHDGDDVKCIEDCGFKSCTIVDDESVGIDDGNIEELEETN